MSDASAIFDVQAAQYDAWFDDPRGHLLFESELAAIRLLRRDTLRPALEVGVGTGRFAQVLGVEFGIDPALGALRLARQRGVRVAQAVGDHLPFADGVFGCVLIVATLCFAAQPRALLGEAARVLRADGQLLLAEIPRDSAWGEFYLEKKAQGHRFYQHAEFFTSGELRAFLREAGLVGLTFASTLTQSPREISRVEKTELGVVARAGFMCISATKQSQPARTPPLSSLK